MLLLWLAVGSQGIVLWLACRQIRALKARLGVMDAETVSLRRDWADTTILSAEAKATADVAQQIASATCRYAFAPLGKSPS